MISSEHIMLNKENNEESVNLHEVRHSHSPTLHIDRNEFTLYEGETTLSKYGNAREGRNNPSSTTSCLGRLKLICITMLLLGSSLMGMIISSADDLDILRNIYSKNVKKSGETSEKYNRNLWILNSIFPLFGIFGSLFSAYLTNKCGRQYTTMFFTQTLIIGSTLLLFSFYFKVLALYFISRAFNGFACSSLIVSSTVWLLEIAPIKSLVYYKPIIQTFINMGVLLMSVVESRLIVGTNLSPSGLLLIFVAFILTIAIFSIGESHKYVYVSTRNADETRKALKKLRGKDSIEEELESTINEIDNQKDSKSTSIRHFLKNKRYVASVSSWCILNFLKHITGINVLVGLTRQISGTFTRPNERDLNHVMVGAVALLGSVVFYYFVAKFPRKLLILFSFLFMVIMSALTSICYVWQFNDISIIICFLLFTMVFQLGIGPIPWFISIEIFPSNHLVTAQGFIAAFSWMGDFLVYLLFQPTFNAIGLRIFYIFTLVNVVSVIFTTFFVEETINQPIEKIQQEYLVRWQHICFGLNIPIHVTHFEI